MTLFEAVSSTEIAAPATSCFEFVCDTQRTPEWQQAVAAIEVLECDEQGRAALVRTSIDAIITNVAVDMRLRYAPHRVLYMERAAGDLKALNVIWIFEDLGNGCTRANFAIEFDPGRALSLLARGPVVQRLESHLAEQPPEGLRRAIESGP
jgi:ribosome-associated toxin RatA of RatAB toxin-antitoxin module